LYAVDVSLTGDTIYAGAQDNSLFVNRDVNSGTQDWVVAISADGGHGAINKSNPEIIYGSTQRGVFRKSTDGGDEYSTVFNLGNTTLGDDNPLFIAPFEMDPNNDATLYAGGERVWQSLDEGANWAPFKPDIVTNRRVTTIEIADGDVNNVWVGYDNGHFWSTSNGGSVWVREDVFAMPNEYVTDIAIHPDDHNDVMVSFGGGYDGDVIWYSSDGGGTWTDRSLAFDIQTYCLTWHPQEAGWAYVGTDLGIFATEDFGENWSVTPLISNHPSGNGSDGPVFVAVNELVWQGNGTNTFPFYLVAATHGRGIWRTSFPIRAKYYVDKNCAPCGLGTFSRPYATFKEAIEAAGNGAEIVFLSAGTYNEVPSSLLLEKRIRVTLHSSVVSPVVIE